MITFAFFGCLVGAALVYWLLPGQAMRTAFLSLASLAFIGLYDPWAVLIVLVLAAFAHGMGTLIGKTRKRVYHRIGVAVVLGILIVFKYLGFLEGTLNSLAQFVRALPEFHMTRLLLPLGISYITFKLISYLTDIYWRVIEPGKFLDVLCYSSLFTIFVAGPIERFERFSPQLHAKAASFSWDLVESGLQRIAVGLFKKLVLADWLGYFTAPVWSEPGSYAFGTRALALLGYSLQIYLDFAGYSDIAIGSSKFFGLTIMENFDRPYLQPNISQFWRHWHISLSDWIRDYLFFPLSRAGRNKVWLIVAVPLLAMGLCGLWHGPAWHFVLWGLWLGLGIVIFQVWSAQKRAHPGLQRVASTRTFTVLSTLTTFAFVTIGWLWFRG